MEQKEPDKRLEKAKRRKENSVDQQETPKNARLLTPSRAVNKPKNTSGSSPQGCRNGALLNRKLLSTSLPLTMRPQTVGPKNGTTYHLDLTSR